MQVSGRTKPICVEFAQNESCGEYEKARADHRPHRLIGNEDDIIALISIPLDILTTSPRFVKEDTGIYVEDDRRAMLMLARDGQPAESSTFSITEEVG